MHKALYVWQASYPWDVRTEKVCKALANNGFDVCILARWSPGQIKEETIDGIRIVRVGYNINSALTQPYSANPIWIKAIKSIIEDFKPDIIIPREILLAEQCSHQAKKKDIPVVIDMAENYPAAMKDFKKYRKKFFLRFLVHTLNIPEKVEKKSVALANGIICVCNENIERINKKYAYPVEKTAVVHNTPEKSFFKNAQLGTNIPPKIFGHHGFTSGDKNIENFLKAFIKASKNNKYIQFIIAGDGESMGDYKELISKENAQDSMITTGKYKISELPQIISQFDVGVIPYQLSDFNNTTIHNKLFDFFACGKPVFLAETAPFKRIIEETNAGVCVDCENIDLITEAIINFHKHDLKTMAENAYNAFKNKYNWENDSITLIEFVSKYI